MPKSYDFLRRSARKLMPVGQTLISVETGDSGESAAKFPMRSLSDGLYWGTVLSFHLGTRWTHLREAAVSLIEFDGKFVGKQ